jgi:putative transposase
VTDIASLSGREREIAKAFASGEMYQRARVPAASSPRRMSRRGNCHDNAVAESFFQLLKRERIRRRTYPTRDAARQDVFEYIELFHNPKRKHTNNGMLSPVDFEIRQQKLTEAGV